MRQVNTREVKSDSREFNFPFVKLNYANESRHELSTLGEKVEANKTNYPQVVPLNRTMPLMLLHSMVIGGAFDFRFKLLDDVAQSFSLGWLVTSIER